MISTPGWACNHAARVSAVVVVAAPQGEVIHAQHPWSRLPGIGQRADQSQ
jgi:hypothetical protein